MDIRPEKAAKTPDNDALGTGECKILKLPPRAPRLAKVEYGSGWYHEAAIAEAGHPPTRTR